MTENKKTMADVQPCPVHAGEMPFDWQSCSGCTAEVAARTAVIDQLQAEAQQRSQGLARSGVQMPTEVMTAIKVDILINALLRDPRNRMMFEAEFGTQVIEQLKQAQAQVSKQNIAPQKRLIVPGN